MYKNINLIVAGLLIVMMNACKNAKQEQVTDDSQYLEVMEIHDAVMPEMATIHRLKRALKEVGATATDESDLVRAQIKKLDDADEAMMQWMAEFNVPEVPDQKTTYLEKEKQKIQAVSDEMYAAIASAQMLLDSIQHENK